MNKHRDINVQHISTGVLINASSFPTIPKNVAVSGREERSKIFDELIKTSLSDVEKSKENTTVILRAFEIVLEYMDEADIWSTIDYPKDTVNRVYEELRDKWS